MGITVSGFSVGKSIERVSYLTSGLDNTVVACLYKPENPTPTLHNKNIFEFESNKTAATIDFTGGLYVTRTHDQRIKSPMLYQLS